jgi:hypothetical protein
MAIYYHNNRSIPYQIDTLPVATDLFLLQGSDSTPESWQELVSELVPQTSNGLRPGRALRCQWSLAGRDSRLLAMDVLGLLKILSWNSAYVVACGDAVELVNELEKLRPGIFAGTLLFPDKMPKLIDLALAVRNLIAGGGPSAIVRPS